MARLLVVVVLVSAVVAPSAPTERQATDPTPEAWKKEIAHDERVVLEPVPHLQGTAPLDLPPEILARQYQQIEDYFLRAVQESAAARDKLWQPDFSSASSYQASVQPHRDRLRVMLGLIDSPFMRSNVKTTLVADGEVRVEEITLSLDHELAARALLFLRRDAKAGPTVIAIPGDRQTREKFTGITEGSEPAPWLLSLLERHAAVCVPIMVERTEDHALAQLAGGERMSRRRLLHRLGFIVGRTLVGLEVQQVLALREYLVSRLGDRPAYVMGQGQGGMTALYSAAVESRFAGAAVADYFRRREDTWQEPVDRQLYGQLNEFGDAEVAALIAPRPLVILTTENGSISGDEVLSELQRAQRFYKGGGHAERLTSESLSGGSILEAAAARVASTAGGAAARGAVELTTRVSRSDVEDARNEHFRSLHDYLRRLDRESDRARTETWRLLATPTDKRDAKAEQLRRELRTLMGVTAPPSVAVNPRTKLLRITDKFVAYEVLLDAAPGLEVFGHLLVPRNIRDPRPAVITQHGLSGEPRDITSMGMEEDTPYHQFGRKLAERGYVTFAPYIATPLPTTIINRLVRQAASLGRMRTSVEFVKLQRVVDFLQALPFADSNRIGFYGLSYGGYAATWMPPLEPRIKLTVISGHFNDWRTKITNEVESTSYLRHPDEDFFNWDVLRRFTHLELIAAMWPRPAMVEFGERDGTTTPEWHTRAWKEVEEWARAWDATDRFVRDRFDGVHEIHGTGACDFLRRWLWPEQSSGRDYVYDLWPVAKTNQGITESGEATLPFVSHDLDASSETVVRGRFHVSSAHPELSGLTLRISRTGNPGDLIVRFGTREGGNDIGEARAAASEILPLYDLRYEARIPAGRLDPRKLYHFEVTAASGSRFEGDNYVVYGPKPLGGRAFPPSFGLSYQVLSSQSAPAQTKVVENRFEFARRLLAPYRGGRPIDTVADGPREGEIRITPQWSIYSEKRSDEVVRTAEEDLRAFLGNVLAVKVASANRAGKPGIELRMAPGVEGVTTAEGFRVDVSKGRVVVSSTAPRGLMRGVYYLEEEMRVRRGPFLRRGATVKNARFATRISMPFLSGGAKYTETSRPLEYTDGLLKRMSHDGFNALWIWLNTEEATLDSKIFPEFNEPDAVRRFERVRDVSERARRFGIDVYIYLATGYHHHLPGDARRFFDRHPETRGYGWGIPLCTSTEKVRRYYSETVKTIFRESPALKGLIVIYDSEGFYYCGNNDRTRRQCPRCRHYSQEFLASQLLTTLRDAMKEQGGADKEFIAWNYDNESDWVYQTLPLLPKDIVIANNFAKGAVVERDGIRHRTGDYNITSVGPPALFVKLYKEARAQKLRYIAKTEHAISQEFIFTPYIPAMEQFFRRIEKIREFDLAGWFGNWSHYGYTPSPNARLIRDMSFDPAPSMEEALRRLALRDFGEKAAPLVLSAWHEFSEGIRQYPYSDNVARIPGPIQKGPSQPLFLDPAVENFGTWRAWQNDLEWTEPWGPEITAKYFGKVRERFANGIAELEAARSVATGDDLTAVESLWRVAKTIESALRSTLHLLEWVPVRDEFVAEGTSESRRADLGSKLVSIAVRERENALQILPILEEDSRLGYASEGGGVVRGGLFSSQLVRWKIGHLEDLLIRRLPMAEERAPIEEKYF